MHTDPIPVQGASSLSSIRSVVCGDIEVMSDPLLDRVLGYRRARLKKLIVDTASLCWEHTVIASATYRGFGAPRRHKALAVVVVGADDNIMVTFATEKTENLDQLPDDKVSKLLGIGVVWRPKSPMHPLQAIARAGA